MENDRLTNFQCFSSLRLLLVEDVLICNEKKSVLLLSKPSTAKDTNSKQNHKYIFQAGERKSIQNKERKLIKISFLANSLALNFHCFVQSLINTNRKNQRKKNISTDSRGSCAFHRFGISSSLMNGIKFSI